MTFSTLDTLLFKDPCYAHALVITCHIFLVAITPKKCSTYTNIVHENSHTRWFSINKPSVNRQWPCKCPSCPRGVFEAQKDTKQGKFI